MEKTKLALREHAQGLVEYGLILAIIALAAMTVMHTLGTNLQTVITGIADNLH